MSIHVLWTSLLSVNLSLPGGSSLISVDTGKDLQSFCCFDTEFNQVEWLNYQVMPKMKHQLVDGVCLCIKWLSMTLFHSFSWQNLMHCLMPTRSVNLDDRTLSREYKQDQSLQIVFYTPSCSCFKILFFNFPISLRGWISFQCQHALFE